ncbi:DUF2927 domain-containing protein [Actinoplanes sp. NPDC049596]|uniref:DUF2927 domain-containing protein n=1 Tax=unclassified Actinoplanes TaxID=2626549 RepID=UPI00342283E3
MRSAVSKGVLSLLLITSGFLAACHKPAHGSVAAPEASVSVTATTKPASTPRPSPSKVVKPKISQAALNYFFAVALGTGDGNRGNVVNRWTDELVAVRVHGFTDAGRSCLDKTIADFNALTRSNDLRLGDGPGDVEIYIAPISKFKSIVPAYDYAEDDAAYYTTTWAGEHQISKATILIRSDRSTAAERCRLIRGELTEVMGLSEESAQHPDSIFYSEYSDAPSRYSALDKAIIRLMYDGAIQPGDSRHAVEGKVTIG